MESKQLIDAEIFNLKGEQLINLRTINNIRFTDREIDIIACLIGGRSYKKISSLLAISPKTVEIHVRNIMLRIGINSRDNIIDFIEKSDKFALIKNHYSGLLIKVAFAMELKKIHEITKKKDINSLIFYYKKQKIRDLFVYELVKDLNVAGINTISKTWARGIAEEFLVNESEPQQVDYIIYVISDDFIEQLKKTEYTITEEANKFLATSNKLSNQVVFILLNNVIWLNRAEKLSDFTCIDVNKQENYYFLVFEVLKKILSSKNINKNINEFKAHQTTFIKHSQLQTWSKQEEGLKKIPINSYKRYKKFIIAGIINVLLITCLAIMLGNFNKSTELSNMNNNPTIEINIDENHAKDSNKVSPGFADTATKFIAKTHADPNLTRMENDPNRGVINLHSEQNSDMHANFVNSEITILNLPPSNTKFTGRNEALKQIADNLNRQKFGIITQVISGLGGVGKTQLATEFAYQAAEKYIYSNILWITAESPNSINNSYREMAKLLQIDIRGLKSSEVQIILHRKLAESQQNTKILFILDNVQNCDDIQPYIRSLNKQFPVNFSLHVLITSRSQYWSESPIILDAFTPEEALNFTKKNLMEEDNNAIIKLTKILHYFPLALNQAVAYIKKHTNIDDYLELYQAKEKDYLDLFAGEENQYRSTLWKTWNIALTKLSDDAKEILFISAFLYPDDIPIKLFNHLPVEVRVEAIRDLRKHSFITFIKNNKSFKIHRLLQEIIQLNITKEENTRNIRGKFLLSEQRKNKYSITSEELWLKKTIDLIRKNFVYNYLNSKEWELCKQYLPHALSVAEHAITSKKSVMQAGIRIYFKAIMFMTYIQLDLKETVQLWENILQLMENNENNMVVANINTNLGYVMHECGELEKSKKYLHRALSLYKQGNFLITDNENEIINDLRLIPFDVSIDLHEQAQYDVCFILIRLGSNARALGQYNKAINYYNEALTVLQQCKKGIIYKFYYANILGSLGTVYTYVGDFIASEKTLLVAKEIVDQFFKNHPLQLKVHDSLAILLYDIGKFDEAKKLLENSLKIKSSIFSKLHLSIAHTHMLLGGVDYMCFNLTLSECNLKQAEQIYSVYHKNSYYCYIFLYLRFSRIYEALKQYDKSLDYLNKVLNIAKFHYGDKLHTAMSFQLTAAENWSKLGKIPDVSYLEKTLKITYALFGGQHIQTARYHYLLGRALEDKLTHEQAKIHYKKALNIIANKKIKHLNLTKINDRNLRLIQKHVNSINKLDISDLSTNDKGRYSRLPSS